VVSSFLVKSETLHKGPYIANIGWTTYILPDSRSDCSVTTEFCVDVFTTLPHHPQVAVLRQNTYGAIESTL